MMRPGANLFPDSGAGDIGKALKENKAENVRQTLIHKEIVDTVAVMRLAIQGRVIPKIDHMFALSGP